MLRFSCEKALLQSAVNTVSRAVAAKSSIPALEGILVEGSDRLTMSGYNMQTGIRTAFEAEVHEEGRIVLNARLFGEIIRKLPDDLVVFAADEKYMVRLTCGDASFEIMGLSAEDYPELPEVDDEYSVAIQQGTLKAMINQTSFAVSTNETRPIHTGSLFEVDSTGVTVVSVDGYRLAIIQRDVECTRDIRIIIPAKTLQELLKIMGGADDDVKIDANRRYVVFTSNGYTIMSRLIEGDFLNYESVIPKDRKTRVTVECKNFIDTIERASLIITERLKNPLRISFAEDRVTVRCQTPLGKVVDEFAPVSMEGDAVEIGFNNRYLLDALRFSKCEKMVLEINGPLSPVKLLPEDGKDFIYLVLPVRFKNEG